MWPDWEFPTWSWTCWFVLFLLFLPKFPFSLFFSLKLLSSFLTWSSEKCGDHWSVLSLYSRHFTTFFNCSSSTVPKSLSSLVLWDDEPINIWAITVASKRKFFFPGLTQIKSGENSFSQQSKILLPMVNTGWSKGG